MAVATSSISPGNNPDCQIMSLVLNDSSLIIHLAVDLQFDPSKTLPPPPYVVSF